MVCAPSTWCPSSAVTPVTAGVTQSQQEGRKDKNRVSKSAFLVTDNTYKRDRNTPNPGIYNRRGYNTTNGVLQNHYVQAHLSEQVQLWVAFQQIDLQDRSGHKD
jgi:hypothetical protein